WPRAPGGGAAPARRTASSGIARPCRHYRRRAIQLTRAGRGPCHKPMLEPVAVLHLRRLGGALLDLLLPPRCLRCNEPVSDQGALCAPCWNKIGFIGAACCDSCG